MFTTVKAPDFAYYHALKELQQMFWSYQIDGIDAVIMEQIIFHESNSDGKGYNA